MKHYNPRTGTPLRKPVIDRIEGIHPYKMINYLIISVSCLLYAFICFMFIRHLAFDLKGDFSYSLPKFFTVSTILLIYSVYFTSRTIKSYENDDIPLLRKTLSYSLITGLLFFISQFISWMELISNNISTEENHITSYLFAFSAIHLVYLLAGLIMSGILFYKYMIVENDPVKTLIISTNPIEKIKLEIYKTFWHFNVISWTMIFLMLLFIS